MGAVAQNASGMGAGGCKLICLAFRATVMGAIARNASGMGDGGCKPIHLAFRATVTGAKAYVARNASGMGGGGCKTHPSWISSNVVGTKAHCCLKSKTDVGSRVETCRNNTTRRVKPSSLCLVSCRFMLSAIKVIDKKLGAPFVPALSSFVVDGLTVLVFVVDIVMRWWMWRGRGRCCWRWWIGLVLPCRKVVALWWCCWYETRANV